MPKVRWNHRVTFKCISALDSSVHPHPYPHPYPHSYPHSDLDKLELLSLAIPVLPYRFVCSTWVIFYINKSLSERSPHTKVVCPQYLSGLGRALGNLESDGERF